MEGFQGGSPTRPAISEAHREEKPQVHVNGCHCFQCPCYRSEETARDPRTLRKAFKDKEAKTKRKKPGGNRDSGEQVSFSLVFSE